MNTIDNIKVEVNDTIKVSKESGKYDVTDANGKTFSVSLHDIVDVSTNDNIDITAISDSVSSKMMNFTPEIKDEEGSTIEDSDLLDMVKSGKAIALDVEFEATHSGGNLNDAVYTSSSLEKDAKTWLFPFAKPLIKNHNTSNEPLGRAKDAQFNRSEFCEDRDCIDVTFRVSDQDAMVKFADGRYKTMSIGARSGYIRCNVCGKDILKDNVVKFCGHWKGNTYAGKKATWTVENMTFREGSVVNTPADVYAQVKRITVVKRKEGKGVSNPNKNEDSNVFDDMDNIMNDGTVTNDNTDENNGNPSSDNTNDNNAPGSENNQEPTGNTSDQEGATKDLQTQLDNANQKVSDLEEQVKTLTADKESVKKELKTVKDENSVLVTDNEALKAEVISVKDMAKRVSAYSLTIMKDYLKAINPEISDAELEGKNAKQVNDMISAALKDSEKSNKQGTNVPSSVTSPGLATKDNHDADEDDGDGKAPETQTVSKTTDAEIDFAIWDKH